MSNSMRPQRRQPTRLCHPWDSPGKKTGVGCHFLLQCMKVKSESEVAQSCQTLPDPMDCSLPHSRQEYWSGVPLPSLKEIFSLSHSIVFCYFFCTIRLRRLLYLSLLFCGTLHSVGFIFPFLPCLLLLFFSQLFVKPHQTTTLPSFISFY